MGESTFATGPGRRSSIIFPEQTASIEVENHWEGCGVLPVCIVLVIFCHSSLITFSLLNNLSYATYASNSFDHELKTKLCNCMDE